MTHQILGIELHEDHVTILTREHDMDCFYALTPDGDFKGTWLPCGSLKTEPCNWDE